MVGKDCKEHSLSQCFVLLQFLWTDLNGLLMLWREEFSILCVVTATAASAPPAWSQGCQQRQKFGNSGGITLPTGQPLDQQEGEISAEISERITLENNPTTLAGSAAFPAKQNKQNQVGGSRFVIPKEQTEKLQKLISGVNVIEVPGD